jgi:nucleoid DNA-binding protein
MTKRDLVVQISQETGLVQEDVFTVLQKALDHVSEALAKGDHVEFRDFGVFEVCTRKARIGRNPNQPDHVVQIPERKVVKFKPGKKMKADVLKSQAQAAVGE